MRRAATIAAAVFLLFAVIITVWSIWPKDAWPRSRPFFRTAFPEIKDWKSLKISLERGPCLGACPIYRVDIVGDGKLVFRASNWNGGTEEIHKTVTPREVWALYNSFREADFYWLYKGYYWAVLDLPQTSLEISFDGQSRKVIDYFGRRAGMPEDVTKLEAKIDALAGTVAWLKKMSRREPVAPLDAPPEPIIGPVLRPRPPSIPVFDVEPVSTQPSDTPKP